MAASLPLDERALILAPARMGEDASKMLAAAGIGCRRTSDIACLGGWLAEGVGVAIVAEESLSDDQQSPLQAFIDGQPEWSDLPIVLIGGSHVAATGPPRERLGNLILLHVPFNDSQLLNLSQSALRARRRQYVARDQLLELHQQLETHAQQRHDEVQALHQARKMEAIGQLAGGVAHDFNNLLTSIGGSLELIERHVRNDRMEKLPTVLNMGQEAVARAARLTHRLLAFSSRQSLESRSVNLRKMLDPKNLRASLSPSVVLQLHVPSDLWPVEADRGQLQEALDNLLLNACEAMPSGGKLTIVASNQHIDSSSVSGVQLHTGDYLRLRISDTGHGMSQSTLERALEPFFSTKPVGQGIGLGLSMVYGFSKQSRGHVTLHSESGHGTQVDLYLPRHQPKNTPAKPAVAAPTPAVGASHEVLLVEDDRHVRQLLSEALLEDGLSCRTASNANEALQVLQSPQPIALMISDVGLPGMNGRQLAEIARKLRPDLPVLFITGYAETAMAREDFLEPGMQLICKPFELAHLQERVARILGKR
ncbi:response regulator [Pseudomonas sp. BP8]|uniref:response regulator n=1 Tax=Pseudomonas sp. BP8 TaxID=2817864 RepID=UPI001AE15A5F|nr:response regulator [Pseudomonas sp. BP8]MBP2262751.1 signal transduction histidine kinase [Pseudomonas sp. BP8]HDS1737652.1 response regulator [Pseudomonas putida]